MSDKEKTVGRGGAKSDDRLISLFPPYSAPRPKVAPDPQSAFNFPEDPPHSKANPPALRFVLEDDNEAVRWRRRTVFLMTVAGETLFIALLLWASALIQRHEQWVQVQQAEQEPKQQATFLVMPPDLLKELKAPPKTNILSDRNRQAHGPSRAVNPKGLNMPYSRGNTKLPEMAGGQRSNRPAAPPSTVPAPRGAPATQKAPQQMAQLAHPREQQQNKLALSDVTPPPSPGSAVNSPLALASPGQSIQQSVQAAAQGRSMGTIPGPGISPDQLNNLNPNFTTSGPIILSNTRGVDFGPYLAQIVEIVRQNWYAVIPESARLGEKGETALVFEILKDGSVPQLRLVASSGKSPLDRAAIAGIRASIPFPPLPSEFTGRHLVLQFNFFYNMTP
ncbi:MAG: TonB family protein [Terriglobia bacterium]